MGGRFFLSIDDGKIVTSASLVKTHR